MPEKTTAQKMFLPLHILPLLMTWVLVAVASPPSTLRHVNMLYRHGDRSPVTVYPLDINKQEVWKDGLGWLSNIGKEQQFELGKYVRDRYGGFLNVTHYDNRQIRVEASAVPRCLMSAYSHLAGLFPPQENQVWNDELKWQPIPVFSRPEEEDNKLALQAKCPRYDQLLAGMYETQKVKNFQTNNADFFKMISKNTGWNETLENIWKVSDTLLCERFHNMTWNDWANRPGVFEQLEKVTEFGWDMMYNTTEMARLKGGPILKEMIENMNAAVVDKNSLLKVHMYSAHDTTVAALLQAMTVFSFHQPIYRTLVMVELHEIDNNDVVKVFLRNDTTRDPYYLIPDGCEDPCKLSTFQAVLKDRLPQDWNNECQTMNSAAQNYLSVASWVALALGCGLLVMITVAIAMSVQKSKHSYSRL